MWFRNLTGFNEENPQQVRNNLEIFENKLISKINRAEYTFGKLEVPKLEELRNKTSIPNFNSKIKVSEVVGNIQNFHKDYLNKGAFFQAASQFNLLEMVGPSVTPESGVDIYEHDKTQGPACAIACGAGTIYRNYFAKVGNQVGQTENNQIDCLTEIGIELKNDELNLWKMKNGYALANSIEALNYISEQIKNKSESEYEKLKGKLRIGIQWDTEVTISEKKQLVTQAYCSALPVAYSHIPSNHWADFACLILEATYEATFWAALINYENTNNNDVFLTLVGGGAFGNKTEWIFNSLKKSIDKFSNTPLNIKIVSYGSSNPNVAAFLKTIN
ncbi:hypothetical protein C7N43_28390 [Sphingobacteriales bacterium UPWRP_1]|nr:hypothetical protein BVG80_18285 [Sphingobacteriales bacterium TSM_CSM]PSJ73592.1 hypothetical protein C7N43_28390 [Sphingobacteriales bacterium UPWRP_1]